MEKLPGARNAGFAIVLILFSSMMVLPVMGADFTSEVSPNLTNTNVANYTRFNITVNNIDNTINISEVIVILYNVDFEFIPGNTSNGTNVSSGLYNFTTISNKELIWGNTTTEGIIENGTAALFWFNATVPSASGNYEITVKTIDTDGNVSPQNKTIVIDNSAPVISLISPDGVNQSSNNVTFNWSVSDQFDSVNCNLFIDGQVNKTIAVSTASYHLETVQDIPGGAHNWSVTCWDDFNNTDNTTTAAFGLYPDLVVSYLEWSNKSEPLNATSNITVSAKIKNVGDFQIEETYEDNETYYHQFNITLLLNDVVKNYTIVNASFDPGEEVDVFTDVPIENIGLGEKTLRVVIENEDVNGTFVFDETNTSNNANTTTFYSGYVVSAEVINVTDEQINQNETVELRVYVNYSNGQPVTNLGQVSFGLTGYYASGSEIVMNTSFSAENASIGLYKFNITTPGMIDGRAKPGIHNITVTVTTKDAGGNVTHSGTGKTYYELFAPDVVIELNPDYTQIEINEYVTFNFVLKNIGNLNVSGVSVKVFKKDGDGGVSVVNGILSDSVNFCENIDVAADGEAPCRYNNQNLKLKGTAVGDYIVAANVSYTLNSTNYYYHAQAPTINIINTTATGEEEETPPAVLGGEGATCDTSADCKSGYWCDNGYCRMLMQDIDILRFPEKVEIVMGESSTFEVEVKNTGVTVSLTKLTVAVDGIDVSIVPSSRALLKGETYIYMVTLNTGSVDVGKYSGTITAFIATDDSIKTTKSFEVRVLPTEEKKAEIDALYENYTTVFDKISEDFEHFKSLGFVDESNLTKVQAVFDALQNTIGDAGEALDAGDYVTAYISLKQFEKFHDQFTREFENLKYLQSENMGSQWSGVWVWFIVGIIALGGGGFVTYKFILIEGYHPKFGYKPKRNLLTQIKSNLATGKSKISGIGTKVNMNMNSIKKPFNKESGGERIANYSSGYQKRYPFNYRYPGKSVITSNVNKIKDFFKKKKSDKYLSDYYS